MNSRSELNLVSHDSDASKKMPGFFFKKYAAVREVSEILEENYGENPANIVRDHFSDADSRSILRQSLDEQSSEVYLTILKYEQKVPLSWSQEGTPRFGSRAENFANLVSGKLLQERLETEGIVLKPFASRVKDCSELSREQYYEQAVRFAYVLAEFAGECREVQEYWEQEQQDKHSLRKLMKSDLLSDNLAQQVFKCDFPEGYLEWQMQQSSVCKG